MNRKKVVIIVVICVVLSVAITLGAVLITQAIQKKKAEQAQQAAEQAYLDRINQGLIGSTYTYVTTDTYPDMGMAYMSMHCFRFEADGTVTDYHMYKTMYDSKYREDEVTEYTYSWPYTLRLKDGEVIIAFLSNEWHTVMVGDTIREFYVAPAFRYKRSVGTF